MIGRRVLLRTRIKNPSVEHSYVSLLVYRCRADNVGAIDRLVFPGPDTHKLDQAFDAKRSKRALNPVQVFEQPIAAY